MTTITFDSDILIQRLKQVGLTEDQAREIVHSIKEAQNELTTKGDLTLLKSDLKAELAELETRLIKWNVGTLVAMTGIFAAIVKLF